MSFILIVIVSVTSSEGYISARKFMCLLLFGCNLIIYSKKKNIQCDVSVYGYLLSFSFNTSFFHLNFCVKLKFQISRGIVAIY